MRLLDLCLIGPQARPGEPSMRDTVRGHARVGYGPAADTCRATTPATIHDPWVRLSGMS